MEAVLSRLTPRPTHVVVRLSLESEAMRQIARNQAVAAVACGATCGGYVWGYQASDPAATVRDALALLEPVNITIPILWIDLEDSPGPDVAWLRAAVAEAQRMGARVGVYSGNWWLEPHFGNTVEFAGLPYWCANYNGDPSLTVPSYGGMVICGHQWTDKDPSGGGLDRDVFSPDVC